MENLPDHFTALPVRPPTPPKEFGSDDIVPSIEQTFGSIRSQPEAPYTPDESPAYVNNYPSKASAKITKHVGFSPLSPNLGLSGYLSLVGPPRVVPPSRDCSSRKSILKSFNIQTIDLSKAEYKDVAGMLENFCRSLASQTKSTRLDAYVSLMNCLKVYKDLPERELLESKVILLADFIKRDMSTEAEDIVDSQIRVQSLKLLNVFLADPSLSIRLPYDFQCHIVDKSIRILEEHTASKAIINLHLLILATQDFRSSVVTEFKALDVLATLEDLNDHVKGNSIVGFRLRIYQRLLRQSKQAMIKCADVWTSHLFIGMLSNIKETRLQALNFGREASMTLGTQSKVSNIVQDTFDQRSPSGKMFVHTVIKRLNDMIKNDDERTDVPHIWAIVVMFLRGRPRQLEHWGYMKEWLAIITKCFNSSNSMVKHHAALAWNRLICAVDLSTWTSPGMIRALKQPVKAQLERSFSEKTSHRSKQMAHSSYCTLLYYAFRPQRPAEQFNMFWEEFVVGLLLDSDDLLGKVDTEFLLRIFTHLFDFGQPWNEKRAAEDPPIRPKDLPCLPPSWIHEHATQILRIFEPLMLSANWKRANDEDLGVVKAWISFVAAIGRASGKEIRISTETMNTVASMMNCFRRILLHEQEPQPLRSQRILMLWKLANLGNIHPLAFTECRLTDSPRGYVTALSTSSSRPDQEVAATTRDSALGLLVKLLCSDSSHGTSPQAPSMLAATLRELLENAISKAPSRQNALKILRDVTSDLDTKAYFVSNGKSLWRAAVCATEESLDSTKYHNATGTVSRLRASDFQEVIKIFELGLRHNYIPGSSWSCTIERCTVFISQEVGNAGLAIGFIEPFASRLESLWSVYVNKITFECTMALLREVVWPTSVRDSRDAVLLVFGAEPKHPDTLNADPYFSLYRLWATALATGCKYYHRFGLDEGSDLLATTVSLLESIPQSSLLTALPVIQNGLVMWINAKSRPSTWDWDNTVGFWKACARAIERLPTFDTATAKSLEPLLVTILSTGQTVDLADVLQLWQNTFGLNKDLLVPNKVSAAWAQIQKGLDDDTRAPATSHTNNVMEVVTDAPHLSTNLKENGDIVDGNATVTSKIDKPDHEALSRGVEEQRAKRPATSARHTTPKSSPKSRHSRHTRPKRLRHEDSQIVFAAIHSSPYDTEGLVSQFLTSHQREARERQQMEANAMFPDIRSDPVTRCARKPRNALVLPVVASDSARKEHVEWSSPISTKETALNDFVQSSPTPGPSRHASSSGIPDEGPPSSPPTKSYNRQAMAGSNRMKESLQHKDQIKVAMNQELEMAIATDALADQDSDAEATLPGLGIRSLHEIQAMNKDDDVEPKLPDLVGQKAQVTGHEIEKEISKKSLAPVASTTNDQVKIDYEQASSGEKVVPGAEQGERREAQPNNSSLKVLDAVDTPMTDNPASETDVYVDSPSSLASTPKKDMKGKAYNQLRKNGAEQNVLVASSLQHSDSASPVVENTAGSFAGQEDGMAARKVDEHPTSSDLDEQASQQITADWERAFTQVEQARRDDSTSDEPDKSSLRKRKKSASSSPEKPSRKSPRRHNVNVVIYRSHGASQEDAYADATVDEDEISDCIVVATSPYQGPAKKRATPKLQGESRRTTVTSRKKQSAVPSTSQRRHSSRLSQASSRAGSLHSDDADERHVPDEPFAHPGHAPVQDREGSNEEETSQSPSQDEEDRVPTGGGRSNGIQLPNLGSPSRKQESEEIAHTSTTNPSSSPTSPNENNSYISGTVQTAGNDLLSRLQNLVQEVQHVVLDREQQRRLLSTWMDLGQELHHADAESRAAKHT